MVHGEVEALLGGARRRGGDGGRGTDGSELERNRRSTLASTDRCCEGEEAELSWFIVDSAAELDGRARTSTGLGSTNTLQNSHHNHTFEGQT